VHGGHQFAEKSNPKHLTCFNYSTEEYSIRGVSDITPLFLGSLGPKRSNIVYSVL
jgi:hypothetical protein